PYPNRNPSPSRRSSGLDNKAKDVIVLDLRGITPLYDFFVIASGASRRQVHTISEEIDAALHEQGDKRLSIEGYQASKWVVQDYGDRKSTRLNSSHGSIS